MLKPQSQSSAAKATFYVFEIAGLVVGVVYFLMGLINAIQGGAFVWFVDGLVQGAIYMLILYGLGRVIDLLYCKAECHAKKEEKKEHEEEK